MQSHHIVNIHHVTHRIHVQVNNVLLLHVSELPNGILARGNVHIEQRLNAIEIYSISGFIQKAKQEKRNPNTSGACGSGLTVYLLFILCIAL